MALFKKSAQGGPASGGGKPEKTKNKEQSVVETQATETKEEIFTTQKIAKDTKKKEETIVDLVSGEDLSWVLISPRVTEKAAFAGGNNCYTFNVATRANKVQIKKAIKKLYKVDPLKINIVTIPRKKKMRRGKIGFTSTNKKALVFLKKGQTIEFA